MSPNNSAQPNVELVDGKPPILSSHLEDCVKDQMHIYGDAEHVTYTAEEGKRVKNKVDRTLLPLMCGCYVFSFLDKTLINYASIFGLKESLHLEGSDYSWLGRFTTPVSIIQHELTKNSIFYIGYMIGSMVWSRAVQRWPQKTGKLIAGGVFVWSILILITPLTTNFTGIAIIRLFLGMLESFIGPVFVIITSNWWTRKEQAFRAACWIAGTPIGNFIGGLLSYGLGSIHSSLATWKIFFFFFGSLSFAYSLLILYLFPDDQVTCRWLNEREQAIAIERVRANQTVTAEDKWHWKQVLEAFKDPQTWFFFVTAIGNTMPSTFASQFSSQIVKGFGFTPLKTTMISTLPAATIQIGTFLVFSYIASHYQNIRLYLSILVSIPPLVGASLLHVLPTTNTAGRLAGYYLTYTHTMSFTLAVGLMASNYAGSTKKATANGFIFAGWAAGLVAGPQFFLERQAPNYSMAFEMLMVCYALMIVVPMAQISWYKWENRRRDKLAGSLTQQGHTTDGIEFTDMTDFEQYYTFRYAM